MATSIDERVSRVRNPLESAKDTHTHEKGLELWNFPPQKGKGRISGESGVQIRGLTLNTLRYEDAPPGPQRSCGSIFESQRGSNVLHNGGVSPEVSTTQTSTPEEEERILLM